MITLYEIATGKATQHEAVDAKEILRASPDLYTLDPEQAAKREQEAVDITKPSGNPRLSDSGFPAGKEFTRRITEDDQRLLQAAQHEGRSLPPAGERVDASAAIRAARNAKVDADSSAMSAADLRAALDAKGVKYPANANKPELRALLDAA